MTGLLLAAAAAAVAYGIGKAWTVAIPLVVGAIVTVALGSSGQPLYDTPIPFAIALATIATVFGLVVRRHKMSLSRA